ncbi:MAG: hypothetical protein WBM35_12740 [Candidatus Electrothrix sp.]
MITADKVDSGHSLCRAHFMHHFWSGGLRKSYRAGQNGQFVLVLIGPEGGLGCCGVGSAGGG